MANPLVKLEKVFRRNPDSPLFARLADLYLGRGQTERALELCQEGCASFPEYSTGFVVLSKCYEEEGDVEKAREAMGHALRLDPENPGGYKRLSSLFQQLGVAPLALQSLQQAAYLDPFDEELHEQIDQLTYEARKTSVQEPEPTEITPLPAAEETASVEALIAGVPQGDAAGEVAEPFAQIQALPEWEDSPDVSEALAEFKRDPDPLIAGDSTPKATEPSTPSEIGLGEDGDSPPPAAPSTPNRSAEDDAVAALGVEIFGGQMPEREESQPEPAAPTPTPAEPVREEDKAEPEEEAEKEAEEEKTAAEAPQEDSWIRYSEQDNKSEPEDTADQISIFSPDVLPEDSEIFTPEEPTFGAPPAPETPVVESPKSVEENPEPAEVEAAAPTAESLELAEESPEPAQAETPEAEADLEPTAEDTPTPFFFSTQSTTTTDDVKQIEEEDAVADPAPATEAPTDPVETPLADQEDAAPAEPAPFLFSTASPVETPASETPAEPQEDEGEADADSLADVAAEVDAPFFFSLSDSPVQETPPAEPQEETAAPKDTSAADSDTTFTKFAAPSPEPNEPATPAVPEEGSTFTKFAAPSPEPNEPATPEGDASTAATDAPAPASEPFGAIFDPEADADETPAESPQPTPANFLSGASFTGFSAPKQEPATERASHGDATPPAEPVEEIADAMEIPADTEGESEQTFSTLEVREPALDEPATDSASDPDLEATTAPEAAESTPESQDEGKAASPGFGPKGDKALLRLFQEIEREEPDPEPPKKSAPAKKSTPPAALAPGHPVDKRLPTMTLAEIYTIQGLTQKAIETYRELLAQDRNNTIIRGKLESLEKSSGKR